MSELPSSSADRLSGLARIAAAGIVWGTIPLFLRAADGSATVKVFYRVFFASLVIAAWMALTGRWRDLAGLPRQTWRQMMLQGLLLAGNWLLFLGAFEFTEVATVELLGYTGPVFVAVLTPMVTGERYDKRIALPLALSLGGIAVILLRDGLTLGTPRQALGAALAAGSALTYAGLLLRSKKLLRGLSNETLMFGEYVFASLVLLPLVAYAYTHGGAPTSLRSYAPLAALGVVHTAGTGFLLFSGLRRVRADHAGILMYTEPVSAVIFAALFLDEPLTVATVVGGIMVVLGGALVARLEPVPSMELPLAGIEAQESDDIAGGAHDGP